MKRLILIAIMGLVAIPSLAEAQVSQMPLPFTKRPVSQQEYAKACRDNDMTILNDSCDTYAEVFNLAYKLEPALRNRHDVADYLERLSVKPLPSGMMTFCRILPDGTYDLTGFRRPSRTGELGLYDNQLNLFIVSLGCGNCLPDQNQNVFTAMVTDDLPRESLVQQASRLASEPYRDTHRDSRGPAWYSLKRTSGKLFWGTVAIGVGSAIYCAVREGGCWMNTNINRNYNY